MAVQLVVEYYKFSAVQLWRHRVRWVVVHLRSQRPQL
jgi:hypothetical protein